MPDAPEVVRHTLRQGGHSLRRHDGRPIGDARRILADAVESKARLAHQSLQLQRRAALQLEKDVEDLELHRSDRT